MPRQGQFVTAQGDQTEQVSALLKGRGSRSGRVSALSAPPRPVTLVEDTFDQWMSFRGETDGFWRRIEDEYHNRKLEVRARWADVVDHVPAGLVYNFVHTVDGQVMARPPKMYVKAHNPARGNVATIFEAALGSLWAGDMGVYKQERLSVRDCVKKGFGVCITEHVGEPAVSEEDQESLRLLRQSNPILAGQQDQQRAAQAAQAAFGPPDESSSVNYEMDQRLMAGRIVTRRVSPWDFFTNYDAGSLDVATVVGRTMIADLARLKKHAVMGPRARQLAPQMMKAQDSKEFMKRHTFTKSPRDRVLLREAYYIGDDGEWRRVTYAVGSQLVLSDMETPYWCGHPYSVLRWNDDGDYFIPQSDFTNVWQLIASMQLIGTALVQGYNRTLSQMTFFDKNSGFDPATATAVINPEVGAMIGVELSSSGNTRVSDLFHRFAPDPTLQSGLALLQMLERQFQVASGMGANQLGAALKSETSATEAAEIANQAAMRGSHRGAAVEQFTVDIARKSAFMMAQFFDAESVARLVGPMGLEWPEDFVKADIERNLDFQIERGSMQPVNDALRFQQVQAILQMAASIPGAERIVNMSEAFMRAAQAIGAHKGDPIILTTDGNEAASAIERARNEQAATGAAGGGAQGVPVGASGAAQLSGDVLA